MYNLDIFCLVDAAVEDLLIVLRVGFECDDTGNSANMRRRIECEASRVPTLETISGFKYLTSHLKDISVFTTVECDIVV